MSIYPFNNHLKKGFTLIELLVVISIIGVLAAISLSFLSTARGKAYDARKMAEMKVLQSALFSYYDSHGTAPINRDPGLGYGDFQPNFLQELVDDKLISTNPKSPSGFPYMYYDYGPGNSVGMLLVTILQTAKPSTQYPGTCRPWPAGVNWCDQASDNYYCMCTPY